MRPSFDMKNQAATAPRPITRIAISMITSLKDVDVQEYDYINDQYNVVLPGWSKTRQQQDISEPNSKSPQ